MYSLRFGHRTKAVGVLQRALGVKDDNIFGEATARAVAAFQKLNGLTVDSIAGKRTLSALDILDEVSELQEEENCYIECSDVKQFDEPHGNKVYGGKGYSKYRSSGCGPTSLTVVVRKYYDKDAAVEDIGEQIYEAGYRYRNNGTSPNAISYIMKQYGGRCKKINWWQIQDYLKQGCLIILHVKEGFDNQTTSKGHYLVAHSVEDGKILLNDVGSNKPRRQGARTYKLSTGIKGIYVCFKE